MDSTWDRITAGGGRLLSELCEGHGAYMLEVYRLDHPGGGRSYLCPGCWGDVWVRLGRPPQPLLGDA